MSAFKEDQILRKGYRISPETLARLRHTINAYKGSHNFWNFTVGKDFKDRSCQRVMKNLTVTDPFMVGDSEWVSLKFHGQSFMLHQIRKMTGLLIMAVRTRTPASLIPETFGPKRLNIPKAPALGLLLEQPQFESYNRKIGAQVGQAEVFASRRGEGESGSAGVEAEAEGGDYPVREQVEYSGIDEAVEKFKREVVFLAMHTEEEKDDTYAKWLNLHDSQLGDDFDYLNAKGVIPPTLGKKKPERAPKNTDGAESSRAGVVPKTEEDDDEEARLARANKGKASAEMEG